MKKSLAVLSISLLLSLFTYAGDEHAQDDQFWADAASLLPAFEFTATAQVVEPDECDDFGDWGPVIPWPHVAVTAASLPDGRVLTFASNEINRFPTGVEFTYATIWDPETGSFTPVNHDSHDMFCGHIVMLPNGKIFVMGGRNTVRSTSTFDYQTQNWTREGNMRDGRWYPGSVAMPNGTVFVASGTGGRNSVERWTEGSGWRVLSNIDWSSIANADGYESHWWPYLFVAPNGKIFHAGPTSQLHWVDPTGNGTLTTAGATAPSAWYPKNGSAVMYEEGKLLVVGGAAGNSANDGNSNQAYTVDLNGPTPVVTVTAPMQFSRKYHNAIVLPNGEVLVIGGKSSHRRFNDDDTILTPEIWNPRTGQWRELADMSVPRNYHSTALLLTSGKVLSAGSGLGGNSADHLDAQLYTPPCLFNPDGSAATQPVITSAPTLMGFGKQISVEATPGLVKFSLIKMMATTHGLSTDQRYLTMPFTEVTPGHYVLDTHSNPAVMTPGFWMLWGLNQQGTHSKAHVVQVSSNLDPVTFVQPANQVNDQGDTVSLQINANSAPNLPLSYSATGLPAGLIIHPASGLISGQVGAASGIHKVLVVVTDGSYQALIAFDWDISATAQLGLADMTAAPAGQNSSLAYTAQFSGALSPQFNWNFGDGSSDTGYSGNPSTTHTYTSPGRFTVTLNAQDDRGDTDQISFVQTIHPPTTALLPTRSGTIVATGNRVWNVNPDNNTVTVINRSNHQKLAEIPVGKNPRSIAIAPNGTIWVGIKDEGRIQQIDPVSFAVGLSIALPSDSRPAGIAFAPDGSKAYVTLEASGLLLQLDPVNGNELARTSLGEHPRHLSVSADSSRIYVSRFISPKLPGEETANPQTETNGQKLGGEVLAINAATLQIEKTIVLQHNDTPDAADEGRGLPNYLGPAAISPSGLEAWVPSKQDNIQRGGFRDGNGLTHDNTLRSIVSRIDLGSESEDFSARVDHDNASIPSTALFDNSGSYLFVALEGSRQIAVIDPFGAQELLRFDAGRAPQGLALSPDGQTLYSHNFMERTVTAHDINNVLNATGDDPVLLATVDVVASEQLSSDVLLGKQHFYDTRDTRLAFQEYISCASCHNEGGHDGRTWDLTGFGEGLRNTINLRGHAGTGQGPLHWSANFDEVQDFEGQIRGLSAGTGLMSDADFNAGTRSEPLGDPKAGISADLDALAAYVASLTTFTRSPNRNPDGTLTAQAVAGMAVFEQENCASCHTSTRFTDSAPGVFHDIGTITAASGQRLNGPLTGFDTPTLLGLNESGPYLHDGSAGTLAEAVQAHSGASLSAGELADLTAFLVQLDGRPLPGGNSPDEYVADNDTLALYHFNDSFDDASANGFHLAASGNVSLNGSNLGWMQQPAGQVARFQSAGDKLTVNIPDALVLTPGSEGFTFETRIYIRNYVAWGVGNLPVFSLYQHWDAHAELQDGKWNFPRAPAMRSGNQTLVSPSEWDTIPLNTWHHLQLVVTQGQTQCYLNGTLLAEANISQHAGRLTDWALTLGNIDADLDEVRLKRGIHIGKPVNQVPAVTAGADPSVIFPNTVQLNGTASDSDGPQALTTTWRQLSGPDTATITNLSALNAAVSFPATGTYLFELSAFDGEGTGTDSVSIEVLPEPPNQAPAVNAGTDFVVSSPNSGTLSGSASDSDGPNTLTTTWSQLNGPGGVNIAQSSQLQTSLSFTQDGTYLFQLSAFDGEHTSTDTITVTVFPESSGDEFTVDAETIALFHLNGNGQDASGSGYHLSTGGNVAYASDNLGWMGSPAGSAARFSSPGDTLSVTIPDSVIQPDVNAAFTLEAQLFVRGYVGWGVGNMPIVSLYQHWDARLELLDGKWNFPAVPSAQSSGSTMVSPSEWDNQVTPGNWHHLQLVIADGQSRCYLNGVQIGQTNNLPNPSRLQDWTLTLGNIDGDIDEVRISRIDRSSSGGFAMSPTAELADASFFHQSPGGVHLLLPETLSNYGISDYDRVQLRADGVVIPVHAESDTLVAAILPEGTLLLELEEVSDPARIATADATLVNDGSEATQLILAENDTAAFASASATRIFLMGFTSAPWIFDITDPDAPLLLQNHTALESDGDHGVYLSYPADRDIIAAGANGVTVIE